MLQRGLLFVAAVAPAVLLRIVTMQEQQIRFAPADLRGLVSDLLLSLAVYAFAVWLASRTRAGAALLIMAWCLLNFGNYEHVSTLGASADIRNIGYLFDRTFFLGSVLSPSSPGLALSLSCATATLLFTALRLPQKKKTVWPVAVVAALGLAALALVPLATNVQAWRQANFVDENLLHVLQKNANNSLAFMSGEDRKRLGAVYTRDLSGTPIVELSAGKPNVLLLILEGISGAHLQSLARVHGIENAIALPELDRIAAANLSYSTFISHNRQTNRGEYAILCGDMPTLVNAEPKMTRALSAQDITCLPDILRWAGYNTVYLQAAPLGFMSKDSFMPMAGFNEVYGEHWFQHSHASNHWGIDDRAFLLQSTEKIAQLQQEGTPWYLTLLTVGTHHPYIVPKASGESSFPNAARYMDAAVAEFIEKITAMGVLDNTLIIITSDESVGISGYRGSAALTKGQRHDEVTNKLADIWGFLIAMTPRLDRKRVDEAFAQIDIATSILDYLGLTGVPNPFIGRSIFREYDSGRPIAFGNLYKNYVGAFDAAGDLHLCSQELSAGCEHFTPPAAALFSPLREPGAADPDAAAFLTSVVTASIERRPNNRSILLTRDRLVRVRDTPGIQVIFGGQYLSTSPHSRISVEIDAVLEGSAGTAKVGIMLQSDQGKQFAKAIPRLNIGDRLTLVFDYYSTAAIESLALLGTVTPDKGAGLVLNFEKATLRVTDVPAGDRQSDAGLSIHTLDTSRR